MNAFFIVCAIAALATVPTAQLQAVIAAAASTLFESIPFILAAAFARRLVPRFGDMLSALTSCGCAHGPGARSLAVAALTTLTFGPLVAIARFTAAFISARALRGRICNADNSVLGEATQLLPCALAAGIVGIIFGSALHPHVGAPAGVVIGLAMGFFAPCTLGAVALAATLRHFSMPAAIAMLAVSGVCDLRSFRRPSPRRQKHDAFAYVVGAVACGSLALAHGGTLVNPRFTTALWLSSAAFCFLTWRFRCERNTAARWAPLTMVAGMLLSHTAPSYIVSETTLSGAAAGDTIDFHGVLARRGAQASLVRYAITCCRADAQPVVVRLEHPL
ncbi:MAG: hypothetical protein JO233_04475, partial [Candidatus Eremiobacteraeota bacterium]|nr:hypothetical protein [Candidatus Eremiobacteraeota bacterium]